MCASVQLTRVPYTRVYVYAHSRTCWRQLSGAHISRSRAVRFPYTYLCACIFIRSCECLYFRRLRACAACDECRRGAHNYGYARMCIHDCIFRASSCGERLEQDTAAYDCAGTLWTWRLLCPRPRSIELWRSLPYCQRQTVHFHVNCALQRGGRLGWRICLYNGD